jgi:hypothetical protein
MKDPEDEAFEELSLKQGQWEHTSGWRKKQILETSMTQDEIFNMAVKCYLISTGNREGFYGDALIQFAKMVAEKALKDHAMQEVQRLGQEIEQERNFCPRCGKRTKDIHTCTPPRENT